jgi:hypothetical protein
MKITMPCRHDDCPGQVEFSSIELGDGGARLLGECDACGSTFVLSGGEVRLVTDHEQGTIAAVPLSHGRSERFVRTIGRARPRV